MGLDQILAFVRKLNQIVLALRDLIENFVLVVFATAGLIAVVGWLTSGR